MSVRRFSILLILIVLWDSIDDQCVAFAQRLSQGRMAPANTSDDDDFIPFSIVYRAQIIAGIRAARFTPVALHLPCLSLDPPTGDLLYCFMSLQL
jgi:hypothetical protein